MGIQFSDWVENIVGKEEIAHYELFLLFPQLDYEPAGCLLPPGGIFRTMIFLEPQGLLSKFQKSAIWRVGLLEVIEVKGQVHLQL